MNNVEQALRSIDGVLSVKRELSSDEIANIYDIAKGKATAFIETEKDIMFRAIKTAFDYGYWQGWKHCAEECEYNKSLTELVKAVNGCTHEQIEEMLRMLREIKKMNNDIR